MLDANIKTLPNGRRINIDKDQGRQGGYKRRQKHQKRGTWPEPGVPLEREGKSLEWIDSCQSTYYQGVPNTGYDIVIRRSIEAIGLRVAAAGLEAKLLEAWADEIDSVRSGLDGFTIVSGQSSYTAATKFEAVILMLCDRD